MSSLVEREADVRRCGRCALVAALLAPGFGLLFLPFMRASVDGGLRDEARTALAGVPGVDAVSSWATVTLTGPPSVRDAALSAVARMPHASAVDRFVYVAASGPAEGTGSSPAASGSPTASASVSAAVSAPAATSSGAAVSPSGAAPSPSEAATAGEAPAQPAATSSAAADVPAPDAATLQTRVDQALGAAGVTFESGSAQLTPSATRVLDRVAAVLAPLTGARVEVGGHTDSSGDPALNRRLSLARAESVRVYLASHGVTGDRLTAKGYGASRPIAGNGTPAGRAANRRIELTVQGS